MEKITNVFIKRPVFATMLIVCLVVLGLFSYKSLGLDLFPNIDLPTVTVTTTLKGASVEEMETSVGYYKMQSMNQALIALLVNGQISYEKAMELSAEPEDLSLKLRKLFPRIEEAAGRGTGPSASDFAEVQELVAVKRRFEQQEETWKKTFEEKDREIEQLEDEIAKLGQEMATKGADGQARQQQVAKMRQENDKLRAEANRQINVLNERIREANQKILEGGKGKPSAPESGSGFFKR